MPQATTATLNPPAVTVPATAPITASVTFATTVQTTRLWWPSPDSHLHPRSPVFRVLPWMLSLAALALLATVVASGTGWMPTRKPSPAAVWVAMLLLLAAFQVSCNNYPTQSPVTQQITGTPYGVFTLTVTGYLGSNNSVTRTTTMNLSVGP
jgi:cytochrome bd-type quinol oxidase subunit 2